MPTEAGDMKIIGNFRKMIDLVTGDADYKPSNAPIKPATLEVQYTAAHSAVQGVAGAMAPHKAAINERQVAFDNLPALVRRSRNMAKASGAHTKIIDDLNTFARKLTGGRKSPKPKDDPSTPANEAGKSHSASQMSYDNQIANFESLVSLLGEVTEYNPNEADLKVTAMTATLNDLKAKNDAVSAAFVPLSQARGVRDQLLYGNADCVVNIALQVKAYVQAAFGGASQLYKQIKGLRFDRK